MHGGAKEREDVAIVENASEDFMKSNVLRLNLWVLFEQKDRLQHVD